MTTLIHLLGADIPHHNLTLLRFFNDQLAAQVPAAQARKFMVVSSAPESLAEFTSLELQVFADKKSLAQAVVKLAADRRYRFSATDSLIPGYGWHYSAGKLPVINCTGISGEQTSMKTPASFASGCFIFCAAEPGNGSPEFGQHGEISATFTRGCPPYLLHCSISRPECRRMQREDLCR